MTVLTPLAGALDGVDDLLVCREVHQVTHDVRSFVLEPQQPRRLDHEPGQYVTVSVEVGGQLLSRCYSIVSPPGAAHLTITVKRVPGGPVSGWLHDHLRPGGTVEVTGPYGSFTPRRYAAARQLHLSAGSGITPLMSAARAVRDAGDPADVVFVHHARTPADIVFRRELEQMTADHPGIRVVVVCEGDSAGEAWHGRRGRISEDLLAEVPDVTDREVFVCGPPPYREAARRLLLRAGVDPLRIHEESYDFGTPAPAPAPVPVPAAAGGPATAYAVELRRSGRSFPCGGGATVLQAAAEAGITLPSSCQEGVCGTCMTTLLQGAVDMHHQGGIRPRQIEQGQVLLCCSTPTDDLVLDA